MLSHVRLVPLFSIRPRLELEHLRDHLRIVADGGGTQLCDGRVHRGALVFVDDPDRDLYCAFGRRLNALLPDTSQK